MSRWTTPFRSPAVKGKEQGTRQFEIVDLHDIVQQSCFSRLAQARSKHIDLGGLCANLLDNALKYTPVSGTVTVSLTCDGDSIILEIEDSGPGIDDALQSRALQPFQRLDNVGETSGAGPGLALVNDIARLHRAVPALSRSARLGGLCVKVRLLQPK